VILASEDFENWPNQTNKAGSAMNFIDISDSRDLVFTGEGKVEGQGYFWWWRTLFNKNPNGRPHLLAMERVRNCLIEGVDWNNSPMYHLNLRDIDNFTMQNFAIYVDIFQ
jgi:polygalacturonase